MYTYLDHQKEVRQDAARQADKEAVTRRIEVQKPFLEKQLALYFEAAQVAGRLVTLQPGADRWNANESRFWELYWSELSMVESEAVEEAMVKLGKALNAYKAAPADKKVRDDLQDAVYELAHAIRDGIEAAWKSKQPAN